MASTPRNELRAQWRERHSRRYASRAVETANYAERIATAAVISAIWFAPLAFGATPAWARSALEIALAGIVILRCWRRDSRPAAMLRISGSQENTPAPARSSLPWTWLPLSLLILGLLQLAPWPRPLLNVLSPLAEHTEVVLAASGVSPAIGCVSVYPYVTLADLRQLFLMAATAIVVADLAQAAQLRQRFATALAGVGTTVWLLGLVLWLGAAASSLLAESPRSAPDRGVAAVWNRLPYPPHTRGPLRDWKSPLLSPVESCGCGYRDAVHVGSVSYMANNALVGDGFGPYVVSNHFAGCLELTLPFAFALGIAASRRRWQTGYVAAATAVAALLAVGTVAVLAGSRAGGVSLAAGLLLTTSLGATSPSARKAGLVAVLIWLLAMTLLVAVALYTADAFPSGQGTQRAMTPLARLGMDVKSRFTDTVVAWRVFCLSPWLGAGLGTYGAAYSFLMGGIPVAYFAHNDYAQWLAETGILGTTLAAGLVIALVVRLRRYRVPWNSEDRPLAAGVAGALMGIAVHSTFDWNLHVPANALLFAVLIGLALALIRQRSGTHAGSSTQAGARFNALARGAIVVAAFFAILLAALEIPLERAMAPLRWAVAMQQANSGVISEQGKKELLRRALPDAEWASRLAPLNADYAERLGQAYLHLSDGHALVAFDLAYREYCRSVRLCPVDRSAQDTLVSIRSRQQKAERRYP